jgi:hypothetical protein
MNGLHSRKQEVIHEIITELKRSESTSGFIGRYSVLRTDTETCMECSSRVAHLVLACGNQQQPQHLDGVSGVQRSCCIAKIRVMYQSDPDMRSQSRSLPDPTVVGLVQLLRSYSIVSRQVGQSKLTACCKFPCSLTGETEQTAPSFRG